MIKQLFKRREMLLVVIIAVLLAAFSARSPGFARMGNLANIFNDTSILIILALGQMTVILTKSIDLSVAANVAFTGMAIGMLNAGYPQLPLILIILVAIGIGAVLGAINGLFVWKLNIPSIVVTLGTLTIYRGMAFVLSGGAWVNAHQMTEPFLRTPRQLILGLPVLGWIAIIIIALMYLVMSRTFLGRAIYASGGNPTAAVYAGIDVGRTRFYAFVISGTLAGLCAYLWVSRYAVAYVDIAAGFELDTVAACVIGGISTLGGIGSVAGAVLGAMFLGVIKNALPVINISPFAQMAISGSVIIAAVIFNARQERRRGRIILRDRGASEQIEAGCVMLKSSRNSSLRIKWASCFEHRPQHAHPSSGQRDEGLCVMFPLTPFSIVEGFGNRVSCRTSAKGALEEDALEVLVAAKGSSPCPAVTGLSDNGRQSGRRRHRIRRSEARDIACRGDETGRQDGPHAWQATDEGRIRVEVEQGLQFFVQPGQPRLDGKGLPGKLPSNCGHSRFSWNNRMLSLGGIERDFHQSRAVGQARASLNVGEKPPGSGTTYLCWRDEACQKMQRSHCCKVERPFQAGVNAADKTAQTRNAPGLFLDKIAAASDQYPDSNGGLIIMLYRTQVRARARLFGNDTGILRIGLGFLVAKSVSSPVHRYAGHVHELEAGRKQGRLQKGRDRSHDIETDSQVLAEFTQLANQVVDIFLRIGNGAIKMNICVCINNANPVKILGNIYTGKITHGASLKLVRSNAARFASIALHSHQGHRVISGRTGVATRPAKPPEPSRTASMIAIAASPACNKFGQLCYTQQEGKAV